MDIGLNLVHGILDYSQIKRDGELILKNGLFCLKDTINKIYQTMKVQADLKKINLKLSICDEVNNL
jgi:signal transduction histidine kinase